MNQTPIELDETNFNAFCQARAFRMRNYFFGKRLVGFTSLNGLVLAPERREREKITSHYGQHPGFDTHKLYVTSKTEVDSHFWLFDPAVGEVEVDLPKLDISVREGQVLSLLYASSQFKPLIGKPEIRTLPIGIVNHSTQQRYLLASASDIRDAFKLRDFMNVPTIFTPIVVLGAWLASFATNDGRLIMGFGGLALLYALMARCYLIFNMTAAPEVGFAFDWPQFWMVHKPNLERVVNRLLECLADPEAVTSEELDPTPEISFSYNKS